MKAETCSVTCPQWLLGSGTVGLWTPCGGASGPDPNVLLYCYYSRPRRTCEDWHFPRTCLCVHTCREWTFCALLKVISRIHLCLPQSRAWERKTTITRKRNQQSTLKCSYSPQKLKQQNLMTWSNKHCKTAFWPLAEKFCFANKAQGLRNAMAFSNLI